MNARRTGPHALGDGQEIGAFPFKRCIGPRRHKRYAARDPWPGGPALGRQLLATPSPATVDHQPAALGGHACAEAVAAGANELGGLISPASIVFFLPRRRPWLRPFSLKSKTQLHVPIPCTWGRAACGFGSSRVDPHTARARHAAPLRVLRCAAVSPSDPAQKARSPRPPDGARPSRVLIGARPGEVNAIR